GTFPPRNIDGVLISGFPCPDGAPNATPPWILPRLQGYRPNTLVPPRHPEFPAQATELMVQQFRTFERLAPRFKFGQVTVFHIDELHHLYGSDSLVLDAWRAIDEAIGRIMRIADNVVLVSDHGSGPMKEYVNVVPPLEGAGLLRLRKDYAKRPLSALHKMGRALPASWRKRLRKRRLLAKVADTVQMRVEPLHEWLPAATTQLRHRIDWSSPVIPLNQGLFYRNPEAKAQRPVTDLADCVSKMPGIAHVWRREEIYSGAHSAAAPDLWAEADAGVEFVARFGEPWERRRPEKGRGWIVNHRSHGIFGFYGKDVDGARISQARIYDMCPTILSFFGVRPPPDIDGVALPVLRGAERGAQSVGGQAG
ncbi:MAG: hypothetical protein E6K18_00855, partial [Methanobacteriota archaeon]